MKPQFLRLLLLSIFAMLVLSFSAFAAERVVGTVNVDVLNVRSAPSLSAPVVGKAYIGEQVLILEGQSDWYKIRFSNGEMYIMAQYVDLVQDDGLQPMTGVVTGSVVNIRKSGSTGAEVVGKLSKNVKVAINSVEGEWFSVSAGGLSGYMHSDYVLITQNSVPAPIAASADAQAILDFAYQYLGVIYRAGGETPSGFDCSGYTRFVFGNFGINLTHSATAQSKQGTPVAKADLIPGDLVFFKTGGSAIGHVGIYVGSGNFIHATVPGDVVKVESMGSNYYTKNYVTAARVLR